MLESGKPCWMNNLYLLTYPAHGALFWGDCHVQSVAGWIWAKFLLLSRFALLLYSERRQRDVNFSSYSPVFLSVENPCRADQHAIPETEIVFLWEPILQWEHYWQGAALCKYCSHEHQTLHAVSCTRAAWGRDVDLDFHSKITFEVCLPMEFSPAVWSAIKEKGQVD